MDVPSGPGVAVTLPAVPEAVGELRRRAARFAEASRVADAQDVALAVSEAVTNAVIHAYAGGEPGRVSLRCWVQGASLWVEVTDEGAGLRARIDSPGMGHGLSVVGALARSLDVAEGTGGSGTVVTMSFAFAEESVPAARELAPLCDLALEWAADASCVDVIVDGVLRRAAAEVAGDPALTEWLRGALPPAKPGTATWEALRRGGTRLVVHDPSIPRTSGGIGERLGLKWWVAVPLDEPGALWGFGGREGGRPVPDGDAIRALTEAAEAHMRGS